MDEEYDFDALREMDRLTDERFLLEEQLRFAREDAERLEESLTALQESIRQNQDRTRRLEKWNANLRKEIAEQKKLREAERENLVRWIDKRIEQQSESVQKSYLSAKTKTNLELEVGILRKYRAIIVGNKHRSGAEDPLMPNFM